MLGLTLLLLFLVGIPCAYAVAALWLFLDQPERPVAPVRLRVVSISRQMDEDAQVHTTTPEPPEAA